MAINSMSEDDFTQRSVAEIQAASYCLHKNLQLPSARPAAIGGMTRKQINAELQKGVDSLQNGPTYTAEEVDAILTQESGSTVCSSAAGGYTNMDDLSATLLDEMLEHSYHQSLAGKGRPLADVFDDLEKRIIG